MSYAEVLFVYPSIGLPVCDLVSATKPLIIFS
jgi:hypothetical protein